MCHICEDQDPPLAPGMRPFHYSITYPVSRRIVVFAATDVDARVLIEENEYEDVGEVFNAGVGADLIVRFTDEDKEQDDNFVLAEDDDDEETAA
jgi:hypothetical protein